MSKVRSDSRRRTSRRPAAARMVARLLAPFLAVAALAYPATAQAPELAMLAGLNKGGWELRFRSDDARQRICVRSGNELIQLRHRQGGCEQFVVEDSSNVVTVQYTCRGAGYGRTTIRRENNGLVQIRSQGIAGGAPFTLDAEGRHIGAC